MIVIYDRATAAIALARDLDPPTRAALEAELALLTSGEHDLTEWTDIVVVEPGDTGGGCRKGGRLLASGGPAVGAPPRPPGREAGVGPPVAARRRVPVRVHVRQHPRDRHPSA